MWEISITTQIVSFLYAIGLGVAYAVVYDVFRSIRLLKPHSTVAVFLEDTFYFLIIALTTFIFLLAVTAGEIRAFILVGIALGFILFFLTISKYFLKVLTAILRCLARFFTFLSKGFYLIFGKIDYFLAYFFKNTLKCLKKGLKKAKGLLYTNRK